MADYTEDEELMDETEKGCKISPDTGMPYMDEDEAEENANKGVGTVIGFFLMPRIIGAGIACAIYFPKKDLYDGRMRKMNNLIDGVGYLFLAGVLFSMCVELANIVPMIFKAAIMPGDAGNLRSNMAIYKVQQKNLPYVVMEDAGYIGKYNRANRAMYHLIENGMGVLAAIVLGGLIFGEAVFVLMAIYAIARLWYQIAYSKNGYGMSCCQHGVPFMIHTVFVAHVLEMLVLVAGVSMLAMAATPVVAAPAA